MSEIQAFTEAIHQHIAVLEKHRIVMEEFIELKQDELSSWCDPEQAAKILGLNITASRKHRRKLSAMVNRGLITKFRDGRPPMYWKEELATLAVKRAAGQVNY